MSLKSNEKYLVVDFDQVIFPEALIRISKVGNALFKAYREFFVDNEYFVSGIFVENGEYYGTLCKFLRLVNKKGTDGYVIGCKGETKVHITKFVRGEKLYDFDFCLVEPYCEFSEINGYSAKLDKQFDKCNTLLAKLKKSDLYSHMAIGVQDLGTMPTKDWINQNGCNFPDDVKVQLFLCKDELSAAEIIYRALADKQLESQIENEISDKVNEDINKDQREYFLRTQLKIINKELNGEDDIEEYREKIELSKAPFEVKERLTNEVNKITTLMPGSPEAYVSRNYLDLVLSLPWGIYSNENTSIENAKNILNEDHYGIDEVKERVLEFLAIHKLTEHKKGNILCFYGPPGTGKTSIVKSIARALGRKYVRISLGGMHDESEIRGHRRTYLASMPGKIITSLKNVGTMNPVFLMDEIDKLSNDYKGDPASALLEVLDPEQNKAFMDNFLDLPFDLSQVLFVTTANDISTIAKPLLDRMELIEMGSYTTEEKEQICLRYLIPKQAKENGLPEGILSFEKQAVTDIILNYTREAGVRTLEKRISKVCRKIAVKFGDIPFEKYVVKPENLYELLGSPMANQDVTRPNEVGVITGLAYTSYGGTTMDMEALLCYGKGELKLTGSLGDVMKESAMQAWTLVKSRADQYNIDTTLFAKDLHINAVEGAVPKDGPSAGIALTTLILSAYTGKKIRSDVALTGEITLSGRVLPIGGVKEKSMGAINRGIKTIVLPKMNQKDVDKLPAAIKDQINYIFVDKIDEVFKVMFDEN